MERISPWIVIMISRYGIKKHILFEFLFGLFSGLVQNLSNIMSILLFCPRVVDISQVNDNIRLFLEDGISNEKYWIW